MREICVSAVGLMLALVSSEALADVAGRYSSADEKPAFDMEMTIEADDGGDVRLQMSGQPNYFLLKAGELYSISRGSDGPVVVRLADMLVIQAEVLQRIGASDSFKLADDDIPKMEFAPIGPETVGAWQGTAYGVKADSGKVGPYAAMVLSDDARIAPIGRAIVAMQKEMNGSMGNLMPAFNLLGRDLIEFLSKGTPVRMMSIELTDVSFDPISPDRFALPAQPESLEALKAQAEPFPAPPTLPPRKK